MIRILTNCKGKDIDRLQVAANAAAEVLGQKDCACVSFEFVSAEKIRDINLRFRGIDKATDVLSFPNLTLEKPQSAKAAVRAKDWSGETDGDGVFLGDVAVCKAMAKEQAIEFLFIHGLLHLFGFDHENEADKKLMRKIEEAILNHPALDTFLWKDVGHPSAEGNIF